MAGQRSYPCFVHDWTTFGLLGSGGQKVGSSGSDEQGSEQEMQFNC